MSRGLVLTGGGARGAYQAGVVQGLAEIAARHGGGTPFEVVTGTSAGAINAAFVAATCDDFLAAAPRLVSFWNDLRSSDVYRTDVLSLGKLGLRVIGDLTFGGLKRTKQATSLLDTSPLRALLRQRIPFDHIAENLASGALGALEVTASDYATAESISFIMARDPDVGWQRARRRSERVSIGLEHVMGSSALPMLFPASDIDGRHFGDGSLRNPAPLSPAIRLGANKLLIVGVRMPKSNAADASRPHRPPTLGRVASIVLNALLMDATEVDIERLSETNAVLARVPVADRGGLKARPIEFVYLQPSVDLGAVAVDHFSRLPDTIKFLIGGLGSKRDASELASYLLFEPEYCGQLTEIGRADALKSEEAIVRLYYGD